MAVLSIGTSDVSLHYNGQHEVRDLPLAEDGTPAAYYRLDSNGKWSKGNASSASEVGEWAGLLANSRMILSGQSAVVARKGDLDVGAALASMAFGAKVFLGTADGQLLDASPAQNEIVAWTNDGTAGSFSVSFNGGTSGSIAYNASTASVEAALEAMSTIGVGNVRVTGAAQAYTVEFIGELANTNVGTVTPNLGGMTGGSNSAVTVSQAGVHNVEIGVVVPVWGNGATPDKLLSLNVHEEREANNG